MPREVALVPLVGEELERARLLGLHARGDERTDAETVEHSALVAKYGDPGFTIDHYAEFLSLDTKGTERTPEDEARFRELGARTGLDGANLSEDVIVEIEERRDSGDVLPMRDVIALDAFHRSNRQQRIDSIPPSAMLAIIGVGRRKVPRRAIPRRASATTRRGSAGRRTTRSSARSPGRQSGSDDPHEHDLAPLRAAP